MHFSVKSHCVMHYLLPCASSGVTPLAALVFLGGALVVPLSLATLVMFSRAGRLLGTFPLAVGCDPRSVTASCLDLGSLERISALFRIGSVTPSKGLCLFAPLGCSVPSVWQVLSFELCLGAFPTLTFRGTTFFREARTSSCLDGVSPASFSCCCGCPLFLGLVSPSRPSLLFSSIEVWACFLGVEVLGAQLGIWRPCGVASKLALVPVNCVWCT